MSKDFGGIPSVRFNRSKFDMSHGVKTTMSVGNLYPIAWQEVIPGDSFKSKIDAVARVSSAYLKPVMDNAFLDIYTFFVPYRLIFDDSQRIFGNSSPSAYEDNDLALMPTVPGSLQNDKFIISEGTIGDYLGLPPGEYLGGELSIAPFRSYALIYDQWFRNENIIDEIYVQKGGASQTEVPNNLAFSPTNYVGKLAKVGKKKDYFTSCLPKTQKGSPVSIPLGSLAPVVTTDGQAVIDSGKFPTQPLKLYRTGGEYMEYGLYPLAAPGNGSGYFSELVANSQAGSEVDDLIQLAPYNLAADLSAAPGASVNDLRFAFQLQKMLERDALYGSRYNEYLLAHFGVTNPDARLQFTEYLGGSRIPLGVQQVAQTSAGTEDSPQANLAGYSLSSGSSRFSKGFTEHGIVMTVACIRTLHTYQQGISKSWFRTSRNDFYDPLFANLGEQPVYTSELFHQNGVEVKSQIFGYNEAWADYRFIPSKVSGQMRSSSQNTLDIWHFADNFDSRPYLSKKFIEETPDNIDRTLAVPSESLDNFILDFWFKTEAIRVMPAYSVPGLIDHH